MRGFLLLSMCYTFLCGCGLDNVVDYIIEDTSTTNAPSKPIIDPNTGKTVQIWMPKDGMIPNKVWESRARVEEGKCSNQYYKGKRATTLFPSQLGVYKKLPNGGRIWAYYYYYGEDSPLATGGSVTNWYETVFNIYANEQGVIYGCIWQKFPFGWSSKHGTSDGIIN